MKRVVAVVNQKGGVGKSTISANLAHAVALRGHRVLAIDVDPQGHLGRFFGAPRNAAGLDDVFFGRARLDEVVAQVRDNLHLVSPGLHLNQVDGLASTCSGQAWTLRKLVDAAEDHDFIVLDCPPSTGLLGMNALLGADELLMPVAADFLALDGLARLVSLVRQLEARTGLQRPLRVVLSRYQGKRRLSQQMYEHLRRQFAEVLLEQVITESVALAESPAYGQTIFEYQPRSRSARECERLANHLLAGMAA